AVVSRLSVGQNTVSPEVGELLKCLYYLGQIGAPSVETALKKLADEGHLLHFLFQISSQGKGNEDSLLWCAMVYLEQLPLTPTPPAIGSSHNGFKYLSTLLDTDDAEMANHLLSILIGQQRLGLLPTIINARN